jgi:hypothetical protein
MEVFIINGTDYSSAIATKGYGWSRNDLDSDKTTRTKDGKMRRDKITTKMCDPRRGPLVVGNVYDNQEPSVGHPMEKALEAMKND